MSFNTHNLIREQLESLTSIVHNMSIQKEEIIDYLSPKFIKRKEEAKTDKTLLIEIDHSVEIDKDKIRPNYRRQPQDRHIQYGCNSRTGSYRHQNYDKRGDSRDRGRVNFRRNFSNDSGDRNRSRTRERSLIPRRNEKRYNSPNANLGTRNRPTSRVTTNRDRVRCYRCREYDHVANECPNAVTDDSDGYESDRAALQLITAEAKIHDNFDTTR